MTNAEIIMAKRMELLEQGKIKPTGEKFEAVINGVKTIVDEPEQIHTYAAWKAMGYQVQKGEKAVARFTIWKHAVKHNEETDEDEGKMFMKTASFFTKDQVAEIED